MQTNLFTNNIDGTLNLNNTEIPNTSGIIDVDNSNAEGVIFSEYIEELNTQHMNQDYEVENINGVLTPHSEEQTPVIVDEEINRNDNKEELDEATEALNNEVVSNDIVYTNNSLYNNQKKDEIGEKNTDGVKYSLSNNLSTSMEKLLEKNITDFSNTTQGALNEQSVIEDYSTDELTGDIDFIEKELDLNKMNSDMQAESEIQTEDLETDQKEIFKQIREGIRGNSTSKSMQIMLKPQQLGKINLNLKFFNNSMHINVFVENENVENLLRQNLEQIISTVNPNGAINIGSITVSKIEDISEKFLSKDSEYSKENEKYKGNPFVHRISKNNYYR